MVNNPVPTKREAILKAAAEVFGKKGFHKAKIEDIAQEAGIGKGTVYEYFSSKEQLFRQILIEGMEYFNKLIQREYRSKGTTRDKLFCLLRHYIDIGRKHRPLAKIALMETFPIDDEFRQWLRNMHRQWIKVIESIVKDGMEKGEIRPLDAALFARIFYGGAGMVLAPLASPEEDLDNVEKLAEEIMDYYLQGIAWGNMPSGSKPSGDMPGGNNLR